MTRDAASPPGLSGLRPDDHDDRNSEAISEVDAFSFPAPPAPVEAAQAEKRLRELLAEPHVGALLAEGNEVETPLPADDPTLGENAELPCMPGYQIVQELGRGGMGIVYLALQSNPRRPVALKVISARSRVPEQALMRFRREATVIGQLQHTNIVPVYEVGEHDGRPYFTMEYLAGGNLAQRLTKAPMTAQAAAQLLETLARAMSVAHESGFVHRDLKPSNILLAGDGTPKVSDFGLAKELVDDATTTVRDLTETGALLGTPNYMAPEQAGTATAAALGPAVDIYGLGAILYECLTGLPPFRAASVLETLDQVRSQEPVPPGRLQPALPRDLQTICLKCLEKSPLKRYASARDLADDLHRFCQGEPIQAVPVSSFGRLVKWSRRRPAWAALWSLVVVVALGSGAGIAYHTSQLQQSLVALSAKEAQVRQAKDQADVNYREAREAINQMLQHSEERIRKTAIPQVRELVAQQAEDALRFFRAAAAKNPEPDPVLQFEVANALGLVGRHRGLLGERAQATVLLEEALHVAEALEAGTPANQLLRGQLHLYLGENLVGQAGRAEQNYLEARTIFDSLQGMPSSLSNIAYERALCRHQLAILYRQTGRYPLAEEQLRQALRLWDVAIVDQKAVQHIWLNRKADSHVMLGLVLYQEKQYSASHAAYLEAEKWCQQVRQLLPNDLDVVATLGTLYLDWGLLEQAEDQNEAALGYYTKAIGLLEPALLIEPNMTRLLVPARNAHGARGSLLATLGRFGEQAEDLQRYGELGPETLKTGMKVAVAAAWARSGDHVRAMVEVENLATSATGKLQWSDYRELAATAAMSLADVRKDSKMAPVERNARIERYGARAVQLLEQAIACVNAENAQTLIREIKTDNRFDSIRSRPDYPNR